MTGSLQTKNEKFYIVLNDTVNGKRKQRWIATGLSVKGNKRKAEQMLREKLAEEGFPNAPIEDVLSYASFPEVTLNFLRHSNIGMKFHDL